MQLRGWKLRFAVTARRVAVFGIAGLLGTAVGCSTSGGALSKGASPEAKAAAVAERADARWAALVKGDWDAAYGYLSPASRAALSLAEFKSRTRSSGFREARIEKVECEAELCKVSLSLTYDHERMKGITTPLSETWVIDQGQAWYVWQR